MIKLYDQALIIEGNDDYVSGELDSFLFAELIVRECAQLVQGVPVDTLGYHTADQKIKEHFGLDK
jgi:hypothetical protein